MERPQEEQKSSGLIEEAVNSLITERLLDFRETLEKDFGLERITPKETTAPAGPD